MFGKLLRADGKRHREHCRHCDWNTPDQEYKDVVETAAIGIMETSVEDENFSQNEDKDCDETERADLSQYLLQVTSGIVIRTNE